MANRNLYKLEMLLLKVLESGDYYGYQLAQSLKELSQGQLHISEGTMYPILYKLTEQGLISDYTRLIKKRQTRVYYHLEETGKQHLEELIKDYYEMTDAIQRILGPREHS